MKQMPVSEFKLLKVPEITDSPCLELTADGNHLCYVVIGVQGNMLHIIRGFMSQIDAMTGKTGKVTVAPGGKNGKEQEEKEEGDSSSTTET